MREVEIKSEFNKDDTCILKGVAIVFMIFHHFVTYPQWQVGGAEVCISDNLAVQLAYLTKVCVPIFAYLTGYAYGKIRETTFRSTIKKSLNFLSEYWLFYVLILICVVLSTDYIVTGTAVFKELLCIDTPIMVFCWYVRFYVVSIFILFVIQKLLRKSFSRGVFVGMVVPFIGFWLVGKVVPFGFVRTLCGELRDYFPVIIAGYLVSYYKIYEEIFEPAVKKLNLNSWTSLAVITSGGFMGRYFCGGVLGFNLDVLYMPFLIYGLINIISEGVQNFRVIFKLLGRYSMGIWFLHCAFFGPMNKLLQPIVYWSKNPVIITAFVLSILLLITRCVYKVREIVRSFFRKVII